MADTSFDLIVVGGGPGGYVAAIRAAQLGMKTGVVEREHLGGICLNWGCIPTKALLRTSEVDHLLHHRRRLRLHAPRTSASTSKKVVERSREVAKQLQRGVGYLLKKNKVTVFDGHGRLAGTGQARRSRRTASRSPTSRPSTSSWPPARGRARCRAWSPTASWSGPTRRRWCRRRCRSRCWWSARAPSASSSPASTATSAPR